MAEMKPVESKSQPPFGTGAPSVSLPGSKPATTPPPPIATTQIGPRPPVPATWETDIARVMGYYLEMFGKQGQAGLDKAEAWIKAELAGS